jgi:hypothetical protein
MFSIQISMSVFGGEALHEMSFTAVFLASVVNWLLIALLLTCKALASSLSAGGINPGTAGGGGVASMAGRAAARQAGKAAAAAGGKALGGAKGLAGGVMNLFKGSNNIKAG